MVERGIYLEMCSCTLKSRNYTVSGQCSREKFEPPPPTSIPPYLGKQQNRRYLQVTQYYVQQCRAVQSGVSSFSSLSSSIIDRLPIVPHFPIVPHPPIVPYLPIIPYFPIVSYIPIVPHCPKVSHFPIALNFSVPPHFTIVSHFTIHSFQFSDMFTYYNSSSFSNSFSFSSLSSSIIDRFPKVPHF